MPFKKIPEDKDRKQIHHILRTWHRPGLMENEPDIGNLFALKTTAEAHKVILECLDVLAREDEQGAVILKERFIQGSTILAVAHKLHLSPDQLNRRQHQAIEKLTGIVINREKTVKESRSVYLLSHLQTPTYTHLFGFDQLLDNISTKLAQTEPPWIISITGIGGIGKTALADAVSRQALTQFPFEDIVWLRALSTPDGEMEAGKPNRQDFRQSLAETLLPDDIPPAEKMAAVSQLLKSHPHLIVIDNLHNEEEFQVAINQISPMLNPSKLILTSRYRPTNPPETWIHHLEELSRANAKELLLHHARQVGIEAQAESIAQNSEAIFQVVGGNPLAIKLIVGLLVSLPLSLVLNDFKQANIADIDRLYRYIYLKAWYALDDNARTLLVSMLQASDIGVTVENIQAFTGFNLAELTEAVQALFTRSLLEPRGSIEDRRYGIHHLTLSFLQTDIVPWPPQL